MSQTLTFPVPAGSDSVVIEVNPIFHTPEVPVNQLPKVNAGANQTIKLPTSSVTLNAVASDPDGVIATYLWEKRSGSGTIISPFEASTVITGLTEGTSVFRCTVMDNEGGTQFDDINIIVQAADVIPPPAGYELVYQTGYDKTSDIINSHGQQGNGGLSTTVYKTPPGSFKSVPANVSSGIRSEVQYDDAQTPLEGAVEYDVMYETIPRDNCHSVQWHPSTNGGSASPGLWHVSGKFDLVNWKNGTNTHHATGITIEKNKWYRMRFEYKFSSNGYMRFFIDGTLIEKGSWTGQVGDGSRPYLKIGVNMWQNQPSVVYYDNLSIYKKVN